MSKRLARVIIKRDYGMLWVSSPGLAVFSPAPPTTKNTTANKLSKFVLIVCELEQIVCESCMYTCDVCCTVQLIRGSLEK